MSTQYIAGAYLLAKPGPMLGAGVLTASACLADMAPDSWAIEWVKTQDGEREERAQRLGVRPADLPALVRWSTEHFGRGGFAWPNVLRDVETARRFRRQFLGDDVARRCAEYASRPEVRTCAQAWHPWLVEEYPA